MSRSVDLFIDADRPLDDLAAAISTECEVRLTPDPAQGRWVLEDGTVHAALSCHRYLDDGDLPFSHYRYALSARVASGRPQDSAEAALLRRIGHRLQEGGGCQVLLVLDLQYRDEPRPDRGAAEAAAATTAASTEAPVAAGDPA